MAQNTIVVRARGARGPVGSQGRDGIQGLQGLQGFTGQVGPAGSGVSILGSYNNFSDLTTNHPTGAIGDAYLVLGDLYVWNATHNVWQNVGAIAGVQGLQGLTGSGVQGLQGLTGSGVQGLVGSQGLTGSQGIQGLTGSGVQGLVGSQGLTGSQGIQGITGIGLQGLTGAQGITGSQGEIGSQGIQGTAGISFSVSKVSFRYEQSNQSSVWNINHNLGFNPNITILDYSGNTIESDIVYVNINNVTLTFSSDVSGYAYLS